MNPNYTPSFMNVHFCTPGQYRVDLSINFTANYGNGLPQQPGFALPQPQSNVVPATFNGQYALHNGTQTYSSQSTPDRSGSGYYPTSSGTSNPYSSSPGTSKSSYNSPASGGQVWVPGNTRAYSHYSVTDDSFGWGSPVPRGTSTPAKTTGCAPVKRCAVQ